MRHSRLDGPAFPSDPSEHADSPTFAAVLAEAYTSLARGAFDEAERFVLPYHSWPMSRSQYVRWLFISASAAHRRQDFHYVIELCEEALAICESLDWCAEFAQLALLCAQAYHNLQLFAPAATTSAEGLSAWLALEPSHDTLDRSLEIDLRDRLSLDLFLLGHYEEASQQVVLAHRLTLALPASRQAALRAASLDWTLALLYRWRGNTRGARQHILSALPTYERHGSTDELARLRIVVADIALDALVPLGSGIPRHYREDLVQLAGSNLTLALDVIKANGVDPAGRAMALIALARLGRVLGKNEGRVALLEAVGHVAEQLHDMPLLSQVYVGLGDEFGAAGRAEEASQLNCYRRALGAIDGSHAPAYGVWARRGLLRAEEYRDES